MTAHDAHEIADATITSWRGDPAEIVTLFATPASELVRQLVPPRASWQRDALCREFDTSLWFPNLGESTQPALEICGRCAVRPECLADALADPTLDHGIRGGMSARARAAHRRADSKRRRPRSRSPLTPAEPFRGGSAGPEGDSPARMTIASGSADDPAIVRLSESENLSSPGETPSAAGSGPFGPAEAVSHPAGTRSLTRHTMLTDADEGL